MLKILIVEDDQQLATTLKYLVEDNPRYRVVATADDLDSAVAAAETHRPELALVDLHLAHGTTGFSVAVRMQDYEIPCFFITGRAPSFPMPDLALGCLMKPFTAEDVHRSLAAAEDLMRGREALRPEDAGKSHALRPARGRRASRCRALGIYPVEALAQDPDRALDRRHPGQLSCARPRILGTQSGLRGSCFLIIACCEPTKLEMIRKMSAKILIVEDEMLVAIELEAILEDLGHNRSGSPPTWPMPSICPISRWTWRWSISTCVTA